MAKKSTQTAQHTSFLVHRNFFFMKLSVLLCAASIFGYVFFDFSPNRNGGTWYGYTLGIVAVLLILWLTMLGLRKRWITKGHWSLKGWTSAHVYLGLSLIIVATLHTGFQFGINLHTLAYAIMIGVIVSGIFGIFFYTSVPRKMSDNRGEMSQSAMLDEIANLDHLLQESARPLQDSYIEYVRNSTTKTKLGGSVFKRLSGEDNKCPTKIALRFFHTELQTADNNFHGPILDLMSVLERKNALLSRIRKHIKFRALLELWLFFHIPLTFALIAALGAHIISVFYYS